MNKLLFLICKATDGGYIAKATTQSIFTEAETIKELKMKIKKAVDCHFEADTKAQNIQLLSTLADNHEI